MSGQQAGAGKSARRKAICTFAIEQAEGVHAASIRIPRPCFHKRIPLIGSGIRLATATVGQSESSCNFSIEWFGLTRTELRDTGR
jgi:hypothetical protein